MPSSRDGSFETRPDHNLLYHSARPKWREIQIIGIEWKVPLLLARL